MKSQIKKLTSRISNTRRIENKLISIGASLKKSGLIREPELRRERKEKIYYFKNTRVILQEYPFLGLFLTIEGNLTNVDRTIKLLGLNKNDFDVFVFEKTLKTAEQWMHRGLELTFSQVEIFSNQQKALKYNTRRYGVNSPFMFTSVDLEINSACNRRCIYCPNAHFKRKHQGLMSWNLFTKIIDELGEIDYDHYIHYHFNNEPLLYPKLELLLTYVRTRCPRARNRIFTNGDFLTFEKFRFLVKAGADYFIVTLHDAKKKRLYKHIEELITKTSKREQTKLDVQFPEDIRLNNQAGLVNFGPSSTKSKNLSCFRPSFKMVIAVNGYVLSCDNDFMEQMVMGDANRENLRKIWVNKKYRRFRKYLTQGKRGLYGLCAKCNKIDHGVVFLFNKSAKETKIESYPYLPLK